MEERLSTLQALAEDLLHEETKEDANEEGDTEEDFSSDNHEGSEEEFVPGSSEEEEAEKEEENEVDMEGETPWMSRNGKFLWSPTHEKTAPFRPHPVLTPGPTRFAKAKISSPETAFNLFFHEEILQLIMHCTNLQGQRFVPGWRDLDKEELQAYLGLLILGGIYKSKHESTRTLWNRETGRPVFAGTMSQKRLMEISRTIRFDDKKSQSDRYRRDKLGPFSDLWSRWNTRLSKMFTPGRDICVNEQLVSFKGRCSFKQHLPSISGKHGLKIWALCDVKNSYVWRLQVCVGKSARSREQSRGMQVVLELTAGLGGRTVTTDNFFTSFPLADELQKRTMALVGTLRKNKPELPLQLLNESRDREVPSSLFAFTNNRAVVSYVPKKGKTVLVMSSRHRKPEVQESGKQEPQMVLDYNACKGAVDHLNQACGAYSCRWKTDRWPMCLFYHMLDISCYNAYILFTTVDPSWKSNKRCRQRLFLEQVGKTLIAPALARRTRLPRWTSAASLVLQARAQAPVEVEKKAKRRKCFLCPQSKRVYKYCCKCREAGCKMHLSEICASCM